MNSSTFSFKNWIRIFFLTWMGLLALFFGLSECLIRMKVSPDDSFEKHRNLFFNSDKSNAVFGDSHGAQDFMGRQDFINLSFPSESVDIIAAKIKLYFSSRRMEKVILQADPHMFSEYRIKENVNDYIRLFEDPRQPLLQILTPRHRKYLLFYWKALISGRGFKSKFRVNPDGSQTIEDREAGTEQETPKDFDLQTRVRLQKPQENFEKSVSVKNYQTMLQDLKERQAQVCLVTFPVSPEYAGEAARFPDFEKARNFFQAMAAQYGFSYVNYWNSLQDPHLFRNDDHLNVQGAKALTQRMVNDCYA
ncbi:MAG: SGNH/GDSL hydrolase family protein [Candidatus Omnitrophica bacterium]|nr:SGNH/GDSL hydrolase family protein [Candidatus Omnitrophota bacterium]